MATYTNISSLISALQKELRTAMTEISIEGLNKARENASEFYEQGKPEWYVRTGTYGTAPNSDGVKGFGNVQETEIYMEEAGHGYKTGTFSAREVWEAVESGSYGVLGKPGRWAETESDVKQVVNDVMSEHFSR